MQWICFGQVLHRTNFCVALIHISSQLPFGSVVFHQCADNLQRLVLSIGTKCRWPDLENLACKNIIIVAHWSGIQLSGGLPSIVLISSSHPKYLITLAHANTAEPQRTILSSRMLVYRISFWLCPPGFLFPPTTATLACNTVTSCAHGNFSPYLLQAETMRI